MFETKARAIISNLCRSSEQKILVSSYVPPNAQLCRGTFGRAREAPISGAICIAIQFSRTLVSSSDTASVTLWISKSHMPQLKKSWDAGRSTSRALIEQSTFNTGRRKRRWIPRPNSPRRKGSLERSSSSPTRSGNLPLRLSDADTLHLLRFLMLEDISQLEENLDLSSLIRIQTAAAFSSLPE